jgi:anti-sigma-K factor RskA
MRSDILMLVVEGLARAPDPVTPPAALKERVLARLAREPQESAPDNRPPASEKSSIEEARHGYSGTWLAAAAVLALALGAALYFSLERERRIASELARVAGEITQLQQELGDNDAQANMVLSILTASDMRSIDLAPDNPAQQFGARAYWSPTHGLLVAGDRLPQPPPGRVFQVWLIGSGGGPVSAGILGSRSPGRGMLIVAPPRGITTGPVTVAITDEPPGGLSAPTGAKHLAGSL